MIRDWEWIDEEYESGFLDAYTEKRFFDFERSMKDWTPHPEGRIKFEFYIIGNKMHWWKYHAGYIGGMKK